MGEEDVYGIRKEGEHWRAFNGKSDLPGCFVDADAARWGFWCSAEVAHQINEIEGRLITAEDTRKCLLERLANAQPPTA